MTLYNTNYIQINIKITYLTKTTSNDYLNANIMYKIICSNKFESTVDIRIRNKKSLIL